jgi:hypothetical protein
MAAAQPTDRHEEIQLRQLLEEPVTKPFLKPSIERLVQGGA